MKKYLILTALLALGACKKKEVESKTSSKHAMELINKSIDECGAITDKRPSSADKIDLNDRSITRIINRYNVYSNRKSVLENIVRWDSWPPKVDTAKKYLAIYTDIINNLSAKDSSEFRAYDCTLYYYYDYFGTQQQGSRNVLVDKDLNYINCNINEGSCDLRVPLNGESIDIYAF